MARPKAVDWAAIESEYRAGITPLRKIGSTHGVSDVAILKRARKEGWPRTKRKAVPVPSADEVAAEAAFIYVLEIAAGGNLFHKIGRASHPLSRAQEHQVSLPFKAVIVLCYLDASVIEEERLLHERFAAKRVRGEWFKLEPDDLRWIAERSYLAGR